MLSRRLVRFESVAEPRDTRVETVRETSGHSRRELRTGRQPGTLAGSAECAIPLRVERDNKIP